MKEQVVIFSVDLSELRRTLPPIVARKKIEHYLGGILSAGYLSNLDSDKKGPPRVKIGRNVGYLRDPLVDWLQSRLRSDDEGGK